MIELEEKLNALGDCYDSIKIAIKEIYGYTEFKDEINDLKDIADSIKSLYMDTRDELQEYSTDEYEILI